MTRLDVIYEPKGPAREYSAWACNIVKSGQRGDGPKSCSHGCLYCYNPPGTTEGPILKDNIIERLKTDLRKLKEIIKPGERCEFTFVGDLHDPKISSEVSRACLLACKDAKVPFQVLTKNGPAARENFDLYGPDDTFGTTLTCDNDIDSLKWEPGASMWSDRIAALKEAYGRGIKTWVSFEPVVDPKQTLHLIELVAPFADKIKVGKMNSKGNQPWHCSEVKYISQKTDWEKFGKDATKLLKSLGNEYYIKDDLKKFIPDDAAKISDIGFESVPDTLRIKRNWCVHRTDGEKAKVPHAIGGYKLQWSIPANWINFLDAKKAYLDGTKLPDGHKCKFEGLGYFISREKDAKLDVYAVDLDDCRNPENGEIAAWAKDLLAKLNSYSEVSPSGTGVHIFVKGMLPEGSKNTDDQMKDKNRIEVFTNKHHITITGERLEEYPTTIEDRSQIIEAIYNEVLEVKAAKKKEIKQDKVKKNRVIYDAKEEAKRKYVSAAIEDEINILKGTPEGGRNNQLNRSAFAIGQFVGAHHISEREATRELERAAKAAGMEGKDGIEATIRSGLQDGMTNPRTIPESADPQTTLPNIVLTEESKKIPESQIEIESPKKQAIANILVKIAVKNCIELWHTPSNECYITVPKNSHKEHYKLSSKAAKIWLGKQGHELMDKVVSGSTIKDAVNVLEGKAIYEGKEYTLGIRKAQIGGKIYVDLGDDTWRAVEIDRSGWRVINECPVKFKRSKNSLPLPMPERGGEIDDLRGLINAANDENWVLILAWLSQAFWCKGPYSHMYLRGPQGTLKSYMMKMLKTITDPSTAAERNLTKSEQDTAIAMGSESITCFGNLSGITNGMADLFCIASTGGVFAKRALYTDDEEAVTNVKCMLLMNGIDDLGQRGDLLDRTIVLDLERVENRRTEEDINAEIEEKKAKLFGCLLDMTVLGLDNIDSIELDDPPRMADFAKWACACLGGAASRFIEIYTEARENTSIDLAETNRLPSAIYSFVRNQPEKKWTGSASLLLANINHYSGIIPGRELEDWPTTPDKMGSELRRFTPALEARGIFTSYKRTGGKRIITLLARDTSGTEETQEKSEPGHTVPLSATSFSLNLKVKESKVRNVELEKTLGESSGTMRHSVPDSDFSNVDESLGGTNYVSRGSDRKTYMPVAPIVAHANTDDETGAEKVSAGCNQDIRPDNDTQTDDKSVTFSGIGASPDNDRTGKRGGDLNRDDRTSQVRAGDVYSDKIDRSTPTELSSIFSRVLDRVLRSDGMITLFAVRLAMRENGYEMSNEDVMRMMRDA